MDFETPGRLPPLGRVDAPLQSPLGAFSFVPRACGYAWPTLARKDVPGFGTCCTRRMLAISSAPDVPDLYNGCASITAILVADILPPTTAPNWDSKHGDCLSL